MAETTSSTRNEFTNSVLVATSGMERIPTNPRAASIQRRMRRIPVPIYIQVFGCTCSIR